MDCPFRGRRLACPRAAAAILLLALTLVPAPAATGVPAAPHPPGEGRAVAPAPAGLPAGCRPLPMDLGPIPRADLLGRVRAGRPPRPSSRFEDETRDSLRIRDQSGGLGLSRGQRPSGGEEKKESDGTETGQSRDSLIAGVLGALPILKKVPLTSTSRGMGLAVGKVRGMGLAVEMPRSSGRRNAPPGEPTVPVLSFNYRF